MNAFTRSLCLIPVTAMLTFAPCAFAQQPPDVVASDGSGNTASGSGALVAVRPPIGGTANSAFGDQALGNDTSGGSNTALGKSALASNTAGASNTASGYSALY